MNAVMSTGMSAVLRILVWALALALLALPVVAVVEGWIGAERWPLRTLRVVGDLERVDADRLRATVLPLAGRGYFAVRPDEIQRAVAKLPWVEQVEVRKQWPDVLVVQVSEHRPFAWWGKDRLLSERRRLLPAAGVDVPAGLPRFVAPDDRIDAVVGIYNDARAALAVAGVDVAGLRLDTRGSWSLSLSNGTEVAIGRDDARLRLARFARLLPRLLADDPRTLVRADLRYANGFALSWGEKPGMGNRESGMEEGRESAMGNGESTVASPRGDALALAHRFPIPASRFQPPPHPFPIPDSRLSALFPIPHSRFPASPT